MIRAVSSTPFPCGIPTTCVVCHQWILPGQLMLLCLPQHQGAHAWHEEVA